MTDDAVVVERNQSVCREEFRVTSPAGEYTFYIEPGVESYEIQYVTDVEVGPGEDKDIGIIELE